MFLKREVGNSKFMLCDNMGPEDLAMVQALYSRSAESAEVHLEKVQRTGSGKFAQSFLVNYNHKSIGDCGTTTLFVEGVSMLAAKAIQDWALYSGQETSTRYVDMSKQRIVDPVGTPESKAILDRWMDFYNQYQVPVEDHIRKQHPIRDGEHLPTYDRAVKARTFDVMRGFLPAGLCTQLSWHTNLRQAGDHLVGLVDHPLAEVRGVAQELRSLLGERYPSSGGDMSLPGVSGVAPNEGQAARDAWNKLATENWTYYHDNYPWMHMDFSRLNMGVLHHYKQTLQSRPRGCILPHFLSELGQVSTTYNLDFGSFRDIQRHRNGVCRMPMLTPDIGFHPWYLAQLEPSVAEVARKLIAEQSAAILGLERAEVAQYYCAMGYQVPVRKTYSLPALLYVMELRSSKTVHPTLRANVLKMVRRCRDYMPAVTIHADTDPDDWDVRRGAQTITAKQ